MTPSRGTRPWLALTPTTPQYAAGRSTEPTVCVPSPSGTIRAPTAAPDPDDEPPGVCSRCQGFPVGAGSRYANSVVAVLPTMTAPAARRRATTVASVAGPVGAPGRAPPGVGMPATSMMYFTPTGTPRSRPPTRPAPAPAPAPPAGPL